MYKKSNKGLILDLDGTLWDSSYQVVEAWNHILSSYKDMNYRMTLEKMHSFMGKTVEEIAGIFFEGLSFQESMDIVFKCLGEEVIYLSRNGGVLYPFIEETLQILSSKYKVMIVSNCHMDYLLTFLEYYKFKKYFCDFECHGRTGLNKSENIKLVIDRNQIGNAIYIGDTQGDLNSAKAAGIPFIHAAYGFGAVNENTYRIESFKELPDLIHDIMGRDEK
jgi:phosphoglycolate phosphatase